VVLTTLSQEPSAWLIDKSALVRLGDSVDPDEWARRIDRGLVHITTMTLLEAGYSARSPEDLRRILHGPPLSSMPVEYMTPVLAERGHHRAPSLPDLLVAATAERAGLTVLHVDKDFELIAEITHQPLERLEMGPGGR